MKTKKQLINNAIGQLEGINRMLEQKEPCQKVIIQMKAVRSALDNIMGKYIQENITLCLQGGEDEKNNLEIEKLIKELIRNK